MLEGRKKLVLKILNTCKMCGTKRLGKETSVNKVEGWQEIIRSIYELQNDGCKQLIKLHCTQCK